MPRRYYSRRSHLYTTITAFIIGACAIMIAIAVQTFGLYPAIAEPLGPNAADIVSHGAVFIGGGLFMRAMR